MTLAARFAFSWLAPTRRDGSGRVLVALACAIAALMLGVQPLLVGAGPVWCRRDPIFSFDGKVGHVYLSVPEDMRQLNNSSSDVLIAHPWKAKTKLIYVDPEGFGTGQGISVNFKETDYLARTAAGYEIDIRVKVPMSDRNVPVLVEFAPAPGVGVTASTIGTSNQWITLRAVLP